MTQVAGDLHTPVVTVAVAGTLHAPGPRLLLVPVADADNVAVGCTAAFALALAAVWFTARRRRRAPTGDLVTATT